MSMQDISNVNGVSAKNDTAQETSFSPGFDAVSDAHEIFQAMYGGMTGLGTDEKQILDILENRTPQEIKAVENAYNGYYRDKLKLDFDFARDIKSEMGGLSSARVDALLEGDRLKADSHALRQLLDLFEGDTQEAYGIIKKHVENGTLANLENAFAESNPSPFTNYTISDLISKNLSEVDQERFSALMTEGVTKAEAMTLHGEFEAGNKDAVFKILEEHAKKGTLSEVATAFQNEFPETNLLKECEDNLTGAKLDRALAYLATTQPELNQETKAELILGADAAKALSAFETLSTDIASVNEIFTGRPDEERNRIVSFIDELYGKGQEGFFEDKVARAGNWNPLLSSDDTSRALAYIQNGELSKAEEFFYSLTLDNNVGHASRVLESIPKSEIEKFANQEIPKIAGGDNLQTIIDEYSGVDHLRLSLASEGKADHEVEQASREVKIIDKQQTGWGSTILNKVGYQGSILSASKEALISDVLLAVEDKSLTPEEKESLRVGISRTKQNQESYQEANQQLADIGATTAGTVAAMGATAASGGLALPLWGLRGAVTVGSGALGGAVGYTGTKSLMAGENYQGDYLKDSTIGVAEGVGTVVGAKAAMSVAKSMGALSFLGSKVVGTATKGAAVADEASEVLATATTNAQQVTTNNVVSRAVEGGIGGGAGGGVRGLQESRTDQGVAEYLNQSGEAFFQSIPAGAVGGVVFGGVAKTVGEKVGNVARKFRREGTPDVRPEVRTATAVDGDDLSFSESIGEVDSVLSRNFLDDGSTPSVQPVVQEPLLLARPSASADDLARATRQDRIDAARARSQNGGAVTDEVIYLRDGSIPSEEAWFASTPNPRIPESVSRSLSVRTFEPSSGNVQSFGPVPPLREGGVFSTNRITPAQSEIDKIAKGIIAGEEGAPLLLARPEAKPVRLSPRQMQEQVLESVETSRLGRMDRRTYLERPDAQRRLERLDPKQEVRFGNEATYIQANPGKNSGTIVDGTVSKEGTWFPTKNGAKGKLTGWKVVEEGEGLFMGNPGRDVSYENPKTIFFPGEDGGTTPGFRKVFRKLETNVPRVIGEPGQQITVIKLGEAPNGKIQYLVRDGVPSKNGTFVQNADGSWKPVRCSEQVTPGQKIRFGRETEVEAPNLERSRQQPKQEPRKKDSVADTPKVTPIKAKPVVSTGPAPTVRISESLKQQLTSLPAGGSLRYGVTNLSGVLDNNHVTFFRDADVHLHIGNGTLSREGMPTRVGSRKTNRFEFEAVSSGAEIRYSTAEATSTVSLSESDSVIGELFGQLEKGQTAVFRKNGAEIFDTKGNQVSRSDLPGLPEGVSFTVRRDSVGANGRLYFREGEVPPTGTWVQDPSSKEWLRLQGSRRIENELYALGPDAEGQGVVYRLRKEDFTPPTDDAPTPGGPNTQGPSLKTSPKVLGRLTREELERGVARNSVATEVVVPRKGFIPDFIKVDKGQATLIFRTVETPEGTKHLSPAKVYREMDGEVYLAADYRSEHGMPEADIIGVQKVTPINPASVRISEDDQLIGNLLKGLQGRSRQLVFQDKFAYEVGINGIVRARHSIPSLPEDFAKIVTRNKAGGFDSLDIQNSTSVPHFKKPGDQWMEVGEEIRLDSGNEFRLGADENSLRIKIENETSVEGSLDSEFGSITMPPVSNRDLH